MGAKENLGIFLRLAMLLVLCCGQISVASFAADSKQESWEDLVRAGNNLRDRGRQSSARRSYETALKILEKQNASDLRKAIVLHDIAETYRVEEKFHQARIVDLQSTSIYKREIKNHQLGYEYAAKGPLKVEAGSLRPACLLCHENWKVVPIFYGNESGYKGEVPDESDWKFTHKPGGAEMGDQRWYCRDCHQAF